MSETAQAIVLAGAVLGAVAYMVRVVYRGFRIVEKVRTLLDHELRPNSGTSLRDQVDLTNRLLTEHLDESVAVVARVEAIERHLGLPGGGPQ